MRDDLHMNILYEKSLHIETSRTPQKHLIAIQVFISIQLAFKHNLKYCYEKKRCKTSSENTDKKSHFHYLFFCIQFSS